MFLQNSSAPFLPTEKGHKFIFQYEISIKLAVLEFCQHPDVGITRPNLPEESSESLPQQVSGDGHIGDSVLIKWGN